MATTSSPTPAPSPVSAVETKVSADVKSVESTISKDIATVEADAKGFFSKSFSGKILVIVGAAAFLAGLLVHLL